MDLLAVRTALANQIAAGCPGLRAMAEARDSISPPCAVIVPGQPYVTYGLDMTGSVQVALKVLVLVSDAPTSERSQRDLDQWLGIGAGEAESIPNAITKDVTLDGTVAWCLPLAITQYGRVDYAGVTYLGATLTTTVGD